jgi:mannose-6-phosphate isomerase-like protein (cupin superfamily)
VLAFRAITRTPLTIALLVGVLSAPFLAGCGASSTRETGAVSSSNAASKTERRALAAAPDPAGAKGKTLSVSRVTVGAGAALSPHFHEGEQVSRVEKGTLTYTVLKGAAPVYTGSPEGAPKLVRRIRAGETADIEPGQWLVEKQSNVHSARNRGTGPVEIVLASLLRTGAPPATPKSKKK